MDEALENDFQAAFKRASKTEKLLPPDLKLKFYAYYKQATIDALSHKPSGSIELRNAFKLNSLFQVKHLSREEAKSKYIELVVTHIDN